MKTAGLRIDKSDKLSLERPAWLSTDWYAFNHRHVGGRIGIVRDYFVHSKGRIK